ncbi:hypothetical protein GOP47_0002439 [Adiantum capillus-veneris]|uniref:Carboxypeptidase n=1 Tax=Adiantum capillus-veneris TaxID=13818 RepID=A0A9D4VA41_ADICA|nr:hypothetical protein GOP47_0002439 [Adiantum capillus-veneris]
MPSRGGPHLGGTIVQWSVAIVVLASLRGRPCHGADERQEVTRLPGQPQVAFKHYAGYITVNESHGRALFYWFFQSSHRNASQRPLVLWLNGGPGCSSVGNGALSELGPFFTNNSGTGLVLNKNAWTKAANIIFLESPYGTGFSYTKTYSDYRHLADQPIAEDAYVFLVGWFKKFPEYAKNEFYLVGESYAGHYIPTLAKVIVRENKKSAHGFHINFMGFAVGNPWTDPYSDNLGTTEFYFSHSLISDETFDTIKNNCAFQNDLPVVAEDSNTTCNKAVRDADVDMTKIDIYNVYGLSCNKKNSSSQRRLYEPRLLLGAYDPCLDSVTPYLNLPAVQSALHITSPIVWAGCSGVVFNNYTKADILRSMLPVYQELLKEDLRIWIYSGDADGVVSTLGTRRWLKKLNLPIEIPWYAWNYKNQVGGWTEKYKGLTFASVRGAGHLVPAVKPGPSLALFRILAMAIPKASTAFNNAMYLSLASSSMSISLALPGSGLFSSLSLSLDDLEDRIVLTLKFKSKDHDV